MSVPFISHCPGCVPLSHPGCERRGSSLWACEPGKVPSLEEDTPAWATITMAAKCWFPLLSPVPELAATSFLPSRQEQGQPVTLISTPIPHPVLAAAQTETEFEIFPHFLVPLGTWVTAVLAPNDLQDSALQNWGPTWADRVRQHQSRKRLQRPRNPTSFHRQGNQGTECSMAT